MEQLQKLVWDASTGKQVQSRGWTCKCKDCDWAVQGRHNYLERTVCYGCRRPKALALNPPRGNSLAAATGPVPGDTTKAEKVEKRREARSKRAAAREESASTKQPAKGEQARKNPAKAEERLGWGRRTRARSPST